MSKCQVCGEHEITVTVVIHNNTRTDTAIIGHACDSQRCQSHLCDKGERWGFELAKRLNVSAGHSHPTRSTLV